MGGKGTNRQRLDDKEEKSKFSTKGWSERAFSRETDGGKMGGKKSLRICGNATAGPSYLPKKAKAKGEKSKDAQDPSGGR